MAARLEPAARGLTQSMAGHLEDAEGALSPHRLRQRRGSEAAPAPELSNASRGRPPGSPPGAMPPTGPVPLPTVCACEPYRNCPG